MSSVYQCVENPPQTLTSADALNEYPINTRMGMYRIAMPMHSTEMRKGEMRFSTSGLALLGAVVLVERDGLDQQYQKCDGHGRGHRPVAVAEELIPEPPADHQIVG